MKNIIKSKILIFYKSIMIYLFLNSSNYTYDLNQKDEISIKNTINEYITTWNQSNVNNFSEAFTSDADFINIYAQRFKGKSGIRDRHNLIF